jgi:hypothetical protein
MRLGDLQVEIKQRSVGQSVALATRLLQRRSGQVVRAWLLGTIPLSLLFGLLLWLDMDRFWLWVTAVSTASLFTIPMVTTVGYLMFTENITLATTLRESLRATPTFVAAMIAMRALTAAGALIALVPGFFVWRWSWFLAPVVVLERTPLKVSLRRARRFADGFHGVVMTHLLNIGTLLVFWSICIATALHFFVKIIGMTVAPVGDLVLFADYPHVLGLIGFAVAVPFTALCWFFVYLDVRTRKEGWDLEISFRAKAMQMESRGG